MVSSAEASTVRLGRRLFERDAVAVFPRDRAFGAAIGQKRWLRLAPDVVFRPCGFLVWGVSDPPPRPPTLDAKLPPEFSWCHRFTIGGRDQLVMSGGFGLHYFRVPHTFEQLISTLRSPDGSPLEGPFEDAFLGVVSTRAKLTDLLLIPKHCELDFRTASRGDELAVEVSGPLDRIVAWGKAAVL